MAELRCANGTTVQISAETETELRKAFGPKPERTYKIGDIFYRDRAPATRAGHYLRLTAYKSRVGLVYTTTGTTVNGTETVLDFNAITFAEVQSMTVHPAGLRLVEKFTVTESGGDNTRRR